MADKQGSNRYKEWREKGGEKLDFWAASLRARKDPNKEHAGLYREAVPSNLSQRLREMEAVGASGGRVGLPTDIPADARKFLEVEAAFLAMAATSATEVFGPFSELDGDGRESYAKFVRIAHGRIRDLCVHKLVEGRPLGQLFARDTFAQMATFGMTKNGFARWLGQRIDDVKEFIGRH